MWMTGKTQKTWVVRFITTQTGKACRRVKGWSSAHACGRVQRWVGLPVQILSVREVK